ncbi:hypothetical protein M406DRAFT_43866 [Cryphonectria parasitica EP155]|uniref:Pyroglutamyl peptidase type I n=1 Tax=Cryphonectria parasitica (strain ATCC 38755 / EP155) TaxID=660469 RepID=A0A9P5CT33_CRYP1|nr:uncharacterized protein M406DRAFT_43866 [Cryphonectria parasitica EP155]KAF3768996.1 hypothetical protein M406DRAFT_43866 [Cryphonectria parasitica EP155]
MGSLDKSQDEFIVLVTGFGPFKNDFPRNPSWDIASSLPSFLPILNAKSPHSVRDAASDLPPVRIVVYPEPVRVTYSAVRALIPRLWRPEFTGVPRIDFVLHIGMASIRPQYVLESLGHRDGYRLADLDNRLPIQDPARDDWPWQGIPSQLVTELDVDGVMDRWEKHLPNNEIPLKVSTNAGRFLCDYIYFNSLAQCFKNSERRRVAFLHVPAAKPDPAPEYEEHIATGREIAIQLIRSIVESELARA